MQILPIVKDLNENINIFLPWLLGTVIQNAKSHSEILFDVIWLCYDIFAYH